MYITEAGINIHLGAIEYSFVHYLPDHDELCSALSAIFIACSKQCRVAEWKRLNCLHLIIKITLPFKVKKLFNYSSQLKHSQLEVSVISERIFVADIILSCNPEMYQLLKKDSPS